MFILILLCELQVAHAYSELKQLQRGEGDVFKARFFAASCSIYIQRPSNHAVSRGWFGSFFRLTFEESDHSCLESEEEKHFIDQDDVFVEQKKKNDKCIR